MMCMSPSSTVGIITKLSNRFDAEVMNWASELKKACLCVYNCNFMILDDIEVDANGAITTQRAQCSNGPTG